MLLTNPTPTLSLAHPRSFQQTQHLRFSAYGHINSVWVRMAVPKHLNMVLRDETINLGFGNNPIISTVYLSPPPSGESLCTSSHKKYTELSFAVCLGPCTPGPILHYNHSTLLPSRDILILVRHVQGQSLWFVLVIQILVHHSSLKHCIFSTINPVHMIVVTWTSQEIPFTAIFLQLLTTRNFHTTLFYHHIIVIEVCPNVCTLSLTIAALLSCSTYCDKWMFLSKIQTWACSVVILSFCYSIPAPHLLDRVTYWISDRVTYWISIVEALPSTLTAADIDGRMAIINTRKAWDVDQFYCWEPRQVTSLRLYPLSSVQLQQKALQFFTVSAPRMSPHHIQPNCGLLFTGLPTPRSLDERIELLNTLLCISPYSILLDGDQCVAWLRSSGEYCYLHTISQPNNGALFFPCRSKINVHTHLAADRWDHSESNTHQPLYSEFFYHTLGPTIQILSSAPPPPLTQSKPWTVGVQMIDGRIFEPALSINSYPPDVMCNVLFYSLFLDAAYVADAAYNLQIQVNKAVYDLHLPTQQAVQVIISRTFLNPEARALSVYLLTVQHNLLFHREDTTTIRDTLHRYFLAAEIEDISPVLIGSHLLYCSASYPAILHLAKFQRRKHLLTEKLFQPLALTITSPQKRQTQSLITWLESKTLGVAPTLSIKHREHPNFPLLQDISFTKQMVKVSRHNSRFIEHDTHLRLKYSVPLHPRLEAALSTALDRKQKDFLISSSGFDDHELTERLFHEYLSLQVHRVDRLSADDILRLQEGLSESDHDRLVASHLSNSPPSKTHG